ncbi:MULTISPECIES: NblA/ycf18 family protein [Okeania]|uniref:Phycobilisome degradation protein nblA n=1 Tax=Okeania hirsuta TaxID=1458930 RepID=A0A3N6PAT7_9CYAN|nr:MULTISPECIES: NblA/ycf18 family protein [Okeania]MDY7008803.1 NblA/ycf18 family protein [Cyanobacteriota bacterium]NEN89122.1 phycobilisome degradation protein nblA [Okeania sp. SIO3H1]NEP05117.1 phycobilisome degradation protein nblA [Okeania sp. SIO4D6]NEP40156.1 phycobilisome degradation protein nblA [Okeania sp. SIO2H7]NES66608.1 phycobilisome degradation protein nblA [Okeania sp. SIO2D1]NET15391.1 phycobilisome degradation protein nblA [Okeania sp. SIO1H6]
MEMSNSLTMEQQFKLQVLREQVKGLSREEAQEYLVEVLRQTMVKENLFKNWMKGKI